MCAVRLDKVDLPSGEDAAAAATTSEDETGAAEKQAQAEATRFLDFADAAIAQAEVLAEQVGAELEEIDEDDDTLFTTEHCQQSVDTIKRWIDQACAAAGQDSDVGKQEIAGLRATVVEGGATMWLSPDAAKKYGTACSCQTIERCPCYALD